MSKKHKYFNSVKRFRLFAGLSQEELAEQTNIKLGTFQAKEQGRTSFNDNEKMRVNQILSKYIDNVSIEELFFREKVQN
ncbi:helix-turn-helix transcriptional regulator [Pediococcus parvulus]|uniref:helix-turn-helix transcriptional regulator n=1 Tax=Pediococcus parvulus TaxID=54062 RepID=UPI0007092FA9|nr:helix-turn-helix transcriptional regulator [Pediococcus parvulus]MCT3027342.1 XRE family transcriptional regulator [Pediococcus parvulus]GEL89306.1 hypothetical protein PPA04_05370 [Pediococcus parvulus]GHC07377.1 hypothetical protein GCM10008912_08640 [Pediococcus parvulus]